MHAQGETFLASLSTSARIVSIYND